MTILSIQSHVSYGHVGNAAGVFILQRLGIDVWPVHTVLYSNHPGYGAFRGRIVESALVADIVSGIEERGVFPDCRAVIGGYIGSAATGDVLVDAVRRVKQANPDAVFFCDPVMGDRDSGLYVSDEIVSFYKERGGAAADILKPNAFELGILSGRSVDTVDQAVSAAADLIHRWALQAVVVSSVPAPFTEDENAPTIACVGVTQDRAWSVKTPLLPVDQKGAGDALLALFVAEFLKSGGDIPLSLEGAVSSIWSLMSRSLSSTERIGRELPLIQGQDDFTGPSNLYKSEAISQ